jgi:hypothetical protein
MKTLVEGRFWRSVAATERPNVLAGALSPEGRFHRAGQRAFYMSSTAEAARHAVAAYVRADDPPIPHGAERSSPLAPERGISALFVAAFSEVA